VTSPVTRLPYCASCGSVESLEQHHLVPRSEGLSDAATVTLCMRCHALVHSRSYRHADLVAAGKARARAERERALERRPPMSMSRAVAILLAVLLAFWWLALPAVLLKMVLAGWATWLALDVLWRAGRG
jgi:hypothetical protein